jgi:hypothetical protein
MLLSGRKDTHSASLAVLSHMNHGRLAMLVSRLKFRNRAIIALVMALQKRGQY